MASLSRRTNARHSLLLCALIFQRAIAQQCYYPDGGLTQGESVKACSSNGGACCPQGWDCLSNGLCYNKAAQYLGRYSCTDKSWGKSCPQFCTDNGSMGGDQAVLQCSDGSYCCDADRTSFNCCENGASRFNLADAGIGTMTGGNLFSGSESSKAPASTSAPSSAPSSAPASTSASQQSSGSSPSTGSSPSSTGGSSSPTSKSSNTPSPSTSHIVTSATSASTVSTNGEAASTVIVTHVTTSASVTNVTAGAVTDNNSSSSPSKSSSSSNKGLIIGLAAGIPIAIAVILIPLLFLLYRRRRRRNLLKGEYRRSEVQEAYAPKGDRSSILSTPTTPEFANGANVYSAKHVQPPAEMDGQPKRHTFLPPEEMAELSALPRTPEPGAHVPLMAGHERSTYQPPIPRRTVGGVAYSQRPPGTNPEYQGYLNPAELP